VINSLNCNEIEHKKETDILCKYKCIINSEITNKNNMHTSEVAL